MSEIKSWLFVKINKFDKPLARLMGGRGEKEVQINTIRNERCDITKIPQILKGLFFMNKFVMINLTT